MCNTVSSYRGMVVAPHYLAAQAGLDVLREGGNAIEAAVATAAALCVVYPHMTGLGGDAFWTIHNPAGGRVQCIDASGVSGRAVTPENLARSGQEKIPERGPEAAITVAGAVSGWNKALEISREWGGRFSLRRLFEDACGYAEHGCPVSQSQSDLLKLKRKELETQPGFSEYFLRREGETAVVPEAGSRQTFPGLGRTLSRLAKEGLDSFYRGALARDIAEDLKRFGSPLTQDDLEEQRAISATPLAVRVSGATLCNCPPPSQGFASLLMLALYDALHEGPDKAGARAREDGFELVHELVECAKRSFILRDAHLGDPSCMPFDAHELVKPERIKELAAGIDLDKAAPWPAEPSAGDTVWLGVVDAAGRSVSCIQSIYFEFGSGLVLPASGIVWHNRGLGFNLKPGHPNCLGPRKRPFHTLNPALALFEDGRVMPYGSMGGEGQPQTQAALFSRYAWLGYDLQEAISAPRWLLGRSWGEQSVSLKLEADFDPQIIARLQAAGHQVEIVPARNNLMGHAGAIVRHRDGLLQGAADPRSDGLAAAW